MENKKCEHCGEWLDKSSISEQKNSPNPTDSSSYYHWMPAICWAAVLLALLSFFQAIGVSFSKIVPQSSIFVGLLTANTYIWLTLRKHFIAKKTIFTQYLILSLLFVCIGITCEILEHEYNPTTFITLTTIYEVVIGIKIIRNFTHTTLLGNVTILSAVVSWFADGALLTQELSADADVILEAISSGILIIWFLTVYYYFRSAPMVAHASNLQTNIATNMQQAHQSKRGTAVGWIVCLTLIAIALSLFLALSPTSPKLYLIDELQYNSDDSYLVGIASNDEIDTKDLGKGWCGDLQIVFSDAKSKAEHLQSALKGSQIQSDIVSVFPSSINPYIVYFNATRYDDFESICGKVHLPTGKYTLFEGDIIGMITKGRFTDCYLVQRGATMYVFKQSNVGESAEAITTFDKEKVFGDVELMDSDVASSAIEWIEQQ